MPIVIVSFEFLPSQLLAPGEKDSVYNNPDIKDPRDIASSNRHALHKYLQLEARDDFAFCLSKGGVYLVDTRKRKPGDYFAGLLEVLHANHCDAEDQDDLFVIPVDPNADEFMGLRSEKAREWISRHLD